MPSAIDITGKKFGRLTAISLDYSTGKRLWRFTCDCGNERVAAVGPVKFGTVNSCGCLRKETTAARNAINLTGRRFDRLLVVQQLPDRNKHGQVIWACMCDCGNTTKSTTALLTRGAKRSCGCLKSELISALGSSSKQENPISRTPEYKSEQRRRKREKPQCAMAERISRLMAWALASVGAIKRSATFDMLGYTPADLKVHIEKQFLSGMSWDNRSSWEIDHIIPISTASCESDVIALNQLSNLRPMWAVDNNKKKNTLQFLI